MKTYIKVSTTNCSYCGKSHDNFRLKVDSTGKNYVICGSGRKAQRVNVILKNPLSKNLYQPGKWTVDRS